MTKAKKPAVQVRQGDLLFVPAKHSVSIQGDGFSSLAEPVDGRFILATGEATGHAHTMSAAQALFGAVGNTKVVLTGPQGAEVTHQEHEVVVLEPHTAYRVVQQTEYDPRTRRDDIPRSNYD